jgi:hypothetical protein
MLHPDTDYGAFYDSIASHAIGLISALADPCPEWREKRVVMHKTWLDFLLKGM